MIKSSPKTKRNFASRMGEGMWAYPPGSTDSEFVFSTKYQKVAPILRYSQIVGEKASSGLIRLPFKDQDEGNESWSAFTSKPPKGWEAGTCLHRIWDPNYVAGNTPSRSTHSIMDDLKLLYEGDLHGDFLNQLKLRPQGYGEFVVTNKEMFLDSEEEEEGKPKSVRSKSRRQNPVREGIQAGQGWDTKLATEKQAAHRASHRIKIAPPAIQIPEYMESGLPSATISDMSLGSCSSRSFFSPNLSSRQSVLISSTVSTRMIQTPSKDSNTNTLIHVPSLSPAESRQRSPIALMTPARSRSEAGFLPQSVDTYSTSSNGPVSPTDIRVQIPKIASAAEHGNNRSSQSPEYTRINRYGLDLSLLNLSSHRKGSDAQSQTSEGSNVSRRSEHKIYDLESPTKCRSRAINFMENYNRAYGAAQAQSHEQQTLIGQKTQIQQIQRELQIRASTSVQGRLSGLNLEHRLIQVPVIPISAQTTPHLPMFQGKGQVPRA